LFTQIDSNKFSRLDAIFSAA